MRCLRRGRVRSTDTACRRRNLRSFSLVRSLSFVLSLSRSFVLSRSFFGGHGAVSLSGCPGDDGRVRPSWRGAKRPRAKAPLPLPPRRLLAGDVEVRPEEGVAQRTWRDGRGRCCCCVSRRRGVFRAAAACFAPPRRVLSPRFRPRPNRQPNGRPPPPTPSEGSDFDGFNELMTKEGLFTGSNEEATLELRR